jgi:hypothetical protein
LSGHFCGKPAARLGFTGIPPPENDEPLPGGGNGEFLLMQRNAAPRATQGLSGMQLLNPDDLVAIDIHTHAEEPCGCHGDDGYDDFQAQMAEYFKSPHKHPPTVPETAAYYRAKKIAAVIFPVDAERETGFRR